MDGQLDMAMDGHTGDTHTMVIILIGDILITDGVTHIMEAATGQDITTDGGMDIMQEAGDITQEEVTILITDILQHITQEEEELEVVTYLGQVEEGRQLVKQHQVQEMVQVQEQQ